MSYVMQPVRMVCWAAVALVTICSCCAEPTVELCGCSNVLAGVGVSFLVRGVVKGEFTCVVSN